MKKNIGKKGVCFKCKRKGYLKHGVGLGNKNLYCAKCRRDFNKKNIVAKNKKKINLDISFSKNSSKKNDDSFSVLKSYQEKRDEKALLDAKNFLLERKKSLWESCYQNDFPDYKRFSSFLRSRKIDGLDKVSIDMAILELDLLLPKKKSIYEAIKEMEGRGK